MGGEGADVEGGSALAVAQALLGALVTTYTHWQYLPRLCPGGQAKQALPPSLRTPPVVLVVSMSQLTAEH